MQNRRRKDLLLTKEKYENGRIIPYGEFTVVLFLQKKIVPISNKCYRTRTTLNIYFEIYFTGRYAFENTT